tara:strand:- start:608 stop:889 length:282 start_codon:yes stop_codon:yes gene_type:complete
MLDEICGQIIMQIIFDILVIVIIATLVNAGMSEPQAELTVIISLICLAIIIYIRWKKRRDALGKAVELDTNQDGYISEEEWAAADMSNNEDTE